MITLSGQNLVTVAKETAVLAHKHQKYGDEPYINHPVRVAGIAAELADKYQIENQKYELQAVALLHDVVEDSEYTIQDLTTLGFPKVVVTAVELCTHKDGEPRLAYLEKLSSDPLAWLVKLADTIDNANPTRSNKLEEKDPKRAIRLRRKYATALTVLHDNTPQKFR